MLPLADHICLIGLQAQQNQSKGPDTAHDTGLEEALGTEQDPEADTSMRRNNPD